MDDRRRGVATAVALMRVGYGTAMAVAPAPLLKVQTGQAASGPIVFVARLFGIRDAVLGAGALLAGDDAAKRGWIAAGVASDGLDAVSALLGARHLGRGRALFVAASATAATAAGAWSISSG